MRINQYRTMWVYDLPTETQADKKNFTKFRNNLLKDGFEMFQFSMYIRHCASRENAEVHIQRVINNLPPKGKIGILTITDKQFGSMQLFYGKEKDDKPFDYPLQLELF
jgi:CRISPR-associated protein Cas2